jgi:hypothetical protein
MIRGLDPMAKTSELADRFDCLVTAGPVFFVMNSLVQDQPDHPTLSVGDGPLWLGCACGTERRYTISKMFPLVLAAALAA